MGDAVRREFSLNSVDTGQTRPVISPMSIPSSVDTTSSPINGQLVDPTGGAPVLPPVLSGGASPSQSMPGTDLGGLTNAQNLGMGPMVHPVAQVPITRPSFMQAFIANLPQALAGGMQPDARGNRNFSTGLSGSLQGIEDQRRERVLEDIARQRETGQATLRETQANLALSRAFDLQSTLNDRLKNLQAQTDLRNSRADEIKTLAPFKANYSQAQTDHLQSLDKLGQMRFDLASRAAQVNELLAKERVSQGQKRLDFESQRIALQKQAQDELKNYRDLRTQLAGRGLDLRADSDARLRALGEFTQERLLGFPDQEPGYFEQVFGGGASARQRGALDTLKNKLNGTPAPVNPAAPNPAAPTPSPVPNATPNPPASQSGTVVLKAPDGRVRQFSTGSQLAIKALAQGWKPAKQ